MTKLLLLMLIFPTIVLAQLTVPKFPIDSTTKLITYKQSEVVPGMNKEALSGVLKRWLKSDLNPFGTATITDNNESWDYAGSASLIGPYTVSVYGYSGQIYYTVYFKVSISATDGRYSVELNKFERKVSDGTLPLESICRLPQTATPNVNAGLTDLYKMYSVELHDIHETTQKSLKRLSKYIAKATKRD